MIRSNTTMETDNILERIHSAGLRFLAPLTLEETYKIIVDEAIKLVDAEYGSILLEENGNWIRVYSSSEIALKTKNRKHGNTYKAYTTNQVIIADIAETGKYHPELKKHGVKSSVFIPLSYQERPLGVLAINAKKIIEQSARELKALKLFGSMATLVIRKSQLYSETKEALKTRDFFISLASHELRTPLTSLNGYVQLLYSKMGNEDTSEARWVKELYDESKRLTNLIQELLEINRIKQGSLQFVLRECHLTQVVKTGIERAKMTHPERVIHFRSTLKKSEDIIIGDFDKLLQVLSSLVNNAVKFSPEKTDITIKIQKKKDDLILSVIDKGVGIERQDIMKVFDGFYKAKNHLKEGMGVGLMLAKHIIQYHHGTIEIISQGKGTTVKITLPIASL